MKKNVWVNFRYEIQKISDIYDKNPKITLSKDGKSVFCSFIVKASMFGKGKIEYDIVYDIEWDSVYTENVKNLQFRQELQHYIPEAKNIFLGKLDLELRERALENNNSISGVSSRIKLFQSIFKFK